MLEQHWCLKHFTDFAAGPRLLDIQSVTASRARSRWALFIAFIPPTPPAAGASFDLRLLGVYFRLNLPVLFTTVFAEQPVYLASAGRRVDLGRRKALGMGPDAVSARHQTPSFWTRFERALGAAAARSALVLGLTAAIAGYLLAQVAWRARVIYQLRRPRAFDSAGARVALH